MPVHLPNTMARQSRKFNPRQRTRRPIGLKHDDDQSPGNPHPEPKKHGDHWFLPDPIGARLNQKSGIGFQSDGGILMSGIEVLFCHWNRHIPLPNDWIDEQLLIDEDFIAKSVIFDVARSGGEIVIPTDNISKESYSDFTFAVKWNRNQSHFKSEPISQIRWFWSFEDVNWTELELWLEDVSTSGHSAEIFVIDDEMDITMYRADYEVLSGNQTNWDELSLKELESIQSMMDSKSTTSSGCYLSGSDMWPLKSIGVEHLSGINLRREEMEWVEARLFNKSPTNDLFNHLVDSGLILRPGFKYGCKWRVYDDEVSISHAPWLLQPLSEAPISWEGTCLAVRLAEGVHKKWVCSLPECDGWKFINIKRWLPGRV